MLQSCLGIFVSRGRIEVNQCFMRYYSHCVAKVQTISQTQKFTIKKTGWNFTAPTRTINILLTFKKNNKAFS